MNRLHHYQLASMSNFATQQASLMLCLSLCAWTYAQQPDSPTAEIETNVVASEVVAIPATPAAARVVIETLAESDLSTPAEWMQAVVRLQELGAIVEAKQYVAKLQEQELTGEIASALYDQFGAGVLMRLVRDKSMAPEGRDLAMSVLRETNAFRRDSKQLARHITALASESDEERQHAVAQLSAAGAEAVPALFDAMRRPSTKLPHERLQAALDAVANQAEEALIAAIGGSDPLIQSEAIRAIRHVANTRSAIHLIRPYFIGTGLGANGESYGDGVSTRAAESLQVMGVGYPSSIDDSAKFLRHRVQEHLHGEIPYAVDADGNVVMWTWNAERKNVVRSTLTGPTAAAVAAARLARDLYELQATPENLRLLLACRLEVDQRVGGYDTLLPRGAGSTYELGADLPLHDLNALLTYCLAEGLDAAAIGAAELLGDRESEAAVITGSEWSPLVTALRSPNRRVRFAAVRAIMKIDPRQRYAGASYVLEALIEMARVSGTPSAIVATARKEVGLRIASQLRANGFEVQRAVDGKDFLLMAFQGSDHDVLFLSDSVNCPPVSETLQQLRKDPRTERTPVVLLAREGRIDAAQRLAMSDPHIVVMPEFADEPGLAETLQAAEQLLPPIAIVPSTQRLQQAIDALQWLTHLAEYSQTYDWYDTMRATEMAEQAASIPDLAPHAIELLGYLGGATSQQILADAASHAGHAMEVRQRAANAFAEAVLRRGLMLKRAEVLRQYDRYNASAAADRGTQDVLGQLLDVIESRLTDRS